MKIVGLSETKQLQYEFWQDFVEYANSDISPLKMSPGRKPRPQHWYNVAIGKTDAFLSLCVNTKTQVISAEIYITDNKDLYNTYFGNKDQIETDLGFAMDWQPFPDGKASRIIVTTKGDISKKTKWKEYFQWYVEKATKLKDAFVKYYQ